jgi:predicted metal-binding membrane protein
MMGMNNGGMMVQQFLPIYGMSSLFGSLDLAVLGFFVFIWVVGMIAMMFPSMIPVVSLYTGLTSASNEKRSGDSLRVPVFLAGYLALYATLGLLAYLAVFSVFRLSELVPWLSGYGILAAGGILLAAGIWQLTPLKNACVKNCTSPMGFFLAHARTGLGGALRMGAEHGYYCVGCCFLYMLVMLGVAAMSIPSMALLAVVITLEKSIVKGAKWFTRLVAAGFIILGMVLWLFPGPIGALL